MPALQTQPLPLPLPSASALAQCPYCGVGCGLELKAPAEPGGLWTARGDRHHPSSLGQVCIKGATVGETLHTPLYSLQTNGPLKHSIIYKINFY